MISQYLFVPKRRHNHSLADPKEFMEFLRSRTSSQFHYLSSDQGSLPLKHAGWEGFRGEPLQAVVTSPKVKAKLQGSDQAQNIRRVLHAVNVYLITDRMDESLGTTDY